MKRRQLLLTSGTGLASALSGCAVLSGDGDESESADDGDGDGGTESATDTPTETPTGPPEFEDISLAADGARVGSELTLTISAKNVGGETGAYEGTVRLAPSDSGTSEDESTESESPSFEESFAIESIAPGETGETEVVGPAFDIADDYEFVIEEADVAATVRVGPASAGIDGSHTLDDDLRVTLTDVEFTPGVHYTYEESSGWGSGEERTSLYGTRPDFVLAVFSFQLENVGTQSASLSLSDLDVTNGNVVTELNGASLYTADLPGQAIPEAELGAGEATEAWVLVQYNREDAADGVAVGYQRDETGTLAEYEWGLTPGGGESLSLPAFTLTGRATPTEIEVTGDPEYRFTVANEGDADGTFRGVLQYRLGDGTDWNDWKPVSADIAAGESAQISVTSDRTDVGTVQYRLQPVDETFEVQFTPAERSRGETFTTPRGLEMAVTEVLSADEITVEDWGEETRTAGEGQQYVITAVELTRPDSDAPESLDGGLGEPDNANFWTTTESDRYSFAYSDPLRGPRSGPLPGDVSLDPEQSVTAYGYHEMPASGALEDVVTRWEDEDGDTVALWHA